MGSIHTRSAVSGGATIYRRVDVIGIPVDDVGDEVAYIIVDHWTRKVACGRTEEQARQNLWRVRWTEGVESPIAHVVETPLVHAG